MEIKLASDEVGLLNNIREITELLEVKRQHADKNAKVLVNLTADYRQAEEDFIKENKPKLVNKDWNGVQYTEEKRQALIVLKGGVEIANHKLRKIYQEIDALKTINSNIKLLLNPTNH